MMGGVQDDRQLPMSQWVQLIHAKKAQFPGDLQHAAASHSSKHCQDWGDGSVSKVLVTQAGGPEIDIQNPH